MKWHALEFALDLEKDFTTMEGNTKFMEGSHQISPIAFGQREPEPLNFSMNDLPTSQITGAVPFGKQ